MNWSHLKAAVQTVKEDGAHKIAGDGFKVYKVSGDIVRIDILPKEKP